jgi:uroporphyrinogen III methyltransferase / synthase
VKSPDQSDSNTGVVYLVGAGPGDPKLITLRAAELLESADVVVYDHLASPLLLSHCPNAKLIYVGKQSSDHTMTQDDINALLVEQGLLGRRVVRLKGGDPFVFGRGGEECQALHEAGVRFEIVPGITAAIAATAYAGIPVTHRDFNSSFTLVTGHEKDDGARHDSEIDFAALAKLPCVAFYMGAKSLPRICSGLIEYGKDPASPAATIQWGATPRQRTVVGTLADLPEKVAAAGIGPPAITIVGKVVTLRPTLSWFEKRPLFGQTIVVTRARQQASELSRKLEDLGASVIEAPTIELTPPDDPATVRATLAKAAEYDWIVFTSANGVLHTKQLLTEMGRDVRALGQAQIAAIGDRTAQAVRDELCLKVDVCPKRFVAEALADELVAGHHVAGKKYLLLRAAIARPILRDRLRAAGVACVDDVAIYQTRRASTLPPGLEHAIDGGLIQWITFTSSSTAKNLVELLGPDYKERLSRAKLASIGPITTETLTELGLKPTVLAETFDIDGLVAAIRGGKN